MDGMALYELTEKGGVTIVTVRADSLDAITVPELRPLVDQLAERGGAKVVFDMGPVRLIDSSGVGVIVGLFKRLRARGGALRDPHLVLLHMGRGAIVDVEISVNIAYGYDIRGEVSCETGIAALPNRPATVISDAGGIRQAIPADWRERFIDAYDQELREWIVAAGRGGATGPSTWDGYAATLTADAALRAVESGRCEPVAMIDKPEIYN
jgi:myo-inositol 2-dehydrogenase/D-chiro-inositol 1-dehydrogenase